jgi:hypothetical protein
VKLIRTENFEDRTVRYCLEVGDHELGMADFKWLDQGMMRDLAETSSVADKLLALEMLARRVEEVYAREESKA